MRRTYRRLLVVAAALVALSATAAQAEGGTFSAATSGSPAPTAHGLWVQESPQRATLHVVAASSPVGATSFVATYLTPFAVAPARRPAFTVSYDYRHQRVTTGQSKLYEDLRYRVEGGKWKALPRRDFALRTEIGDTDSYAGFGGGAATGKRPVQWEWRLTGTLGGTDAVDALVTVEQLTD